jgi:hypothetical protein
MKATLEVINRMRADGVIGNYAIGGAVGALFYLEPSDTADIDVFVSLEEAKKGELLSLAPIYSYLRGRGFREQNEAIFIEGWPVQFLAPADALGVEALAQAVETDLDGVPVRIMTAEHLVALALQVGRGKDHLRILSFLDSGRLDKNRLQAILTRHGLLDKWRNFERKFRSGGE